MNAANDLERALRRAQLLTEFARRMAELRCTCSTTTGGKLCPSCDARTTLALLPPLDAPTYTREPGSRRRV